LTKLKIRLAVVKSGSNICVAAGIKTYQCFFRNHSTGL